MLDLFLKLIDRLISLSKEGRENSERQVEKYVTPLASDFEKVHQWYLEVLKRYEDATRLSDFSLPKLIETMEADLLFSESARNRVREFALSGLSGSSENEALFLSFYRYLFGLGDVEYMVIRGESGTSRMSKFYGKVAAIELTTSASVELAKKFAEEIVWPEEVKSKDEMDRYFNEPYDENLSTRPQIYIAPLVLRFKEILPYYQAYMGDPEQHEKMQEYLRVMIHETVSKLNRAHDEVMRELSQVQATFSRM